MQALADFQRRLLPRQVPQPAGWQVAAHCQVSACPGGNFYDFWPLPDGRIGLLVADASCRGGTAPAMVSQVRLMLHSCPLSSGTGRLPFCPVDGRCTQPPHVVLGHLNHVLRENSLEGESLTAFFGLLDPTSGVLQYANAGHPLPRLWRAGGGVQPVPDLDGLPLGAVQPVPDVTGPPLGAGLADVDLSCNLPLDPGDVLVCFTEGLTDARNAREERYGLDRLDAAILEGALRGAEEVKRRVLSSLDQFLAGQDPQDDLTLLVVERKV